MFFNTQKISLSSSLLELKSAAQKIFGSNLVLKDKIVSGTPLKLWELLYSFKQKAGTNPASCDLASFFNQARTHIVAVRGDDGS